jgi:hypothetical protein
MTNTQHTPEKIGAGHARSLHPYVQWGLRDPRGRWVMNHSGKDILRFDSESAAIAKAEGR